MLKSKLSPTISLFYYYKFSSIFLKIEATPGDPYIFFKADRLKTNKKDTLKLYIYGTQI